MMAALRPDLPPLPARMAGLPVNEVGYPVPWFVAWIGGKPDLRVVDATKYRPAVREHLCWLCGQRLGRNVTYVIGPMCAVNRVSSEPPSHYDCAEFAAMACPFLTRPKAPRNEKAVPDHSEAAGVGLKRNPGVALLWTTRDPLDIIRVDAEPDAPGGPIQAGILFRVGHPERVDWFAEGRQATRAEVEASILSGCEILRETATIEGPEAVAHLERSLMTALELVPA